MAGSSHGAPFKMKGISPLKQKPKKVKMLKGTTIFGLSPRKFLKKAKKKTEDILGITTIKDMGKVVVDVYKDLKKDHSNIKRVK